jgi:tetratricopeptide (TPR) repeat protein
MDSQILIGLIPVAVVVGGAVGWLGRQYQYHREAKRQAGLDADQTLKEKKFLLEELISKTENSDKKVEFQRCLDDVNTALIGLSTARVRRTLNDAGLPSEERLIAEGKNQLKPQQIAQLNRETIELKSLPPSDSIEDLFTLASAYYYAAKYKDAKETYDKILKSDPNNLYALNNRGNNFEKLERHDEALADYNRSLELKPNDPLILCNRGVTYDSLEKYDEALADYNRSLELKPDYPVALMNRGITFRNLEKYDEALADYNHSLELKPDYPVALMNRGITFRYLEKYDESLADYNRSLELKPDDPITLMNRGITFRYLEKYDEALADYNRSLKLKPDDLGILFNLSCLFSLQGKTDDALKYLEKAISKEKKWKEKAKTDDDFDNIRNDLRFKKLIGD